MSDVALRTNTPCDTMPRRSWLGSEPARASMGQREVLIQADGARAEPIKRKSCLIPLMAWARIGFSFCFRCGMPAVVGSFSLIDGLVG